MTKELKILTNVFLNTTDNNVVPVNIYFDDAIIKIERISSKEFNWDDIKTFESKLKLTSQFTANPIPGKSKIIDGKFNLVIPGAMDPHVHFDTPGFEFRDTFEHGSTAAAFGGVTTIIDMPCTSLPPVTTLTNFEEKLSIVKDRSLIDFAFWGGVRGNDFDQKINVEKNINELNEAGVASFKAYLISGMDTFKDLSFDQMKRVAEIISKIGKPLGVHAEDKNLIEARREEYKRNNQNSWEHYCNAQDSLAEEAAVKDMIKIGELTGAKVHIVHLSSELGLTSIQNAQQKGINITAETCSHYLHFTQNDFKNDSIRNYLKTAPPVKFENDKQALWQGLKEGSLKFVTTDHAGCNPNEEKINEDFWKVYGGIPGVEHRVPHLISEGFIKQKLNLNQTINLLSTNVAEYFNLNKKGKIVEGYDADFALINLWEKEIVKSQNMHSIGKYTPFEGTEFSCKIEKTILRGKVIMDKEGKADEQIGYGKFIEVH
ncbi:MAG: amidohydrolase family protein [Ignavibacteriae bacterium]|nr:amidohydrolase family protein [Ignavibacteriota bacterium]